MMKFFSRISADIDRDLKNPKFSIKFYGIIFTVIFIVFGLLGIIPLYKTIKEKRVLVTDLSQRLKTTKGNLEYLENAKQALSSNPDDIALLDRYMPIDMEVQSYMIDFIDNASTSGFSVKSFNQLSKSEIPGGIELNTSLESTIYPTDPVLGIEKLKRVTQVTKVNFLQRKPGEYTTTLGVIIFNYLP